MGIGGTGTIDKGMGALSSLGLKLLESERASGNELKMMIIS